MTTNIEEMLIQRMRTLPVERQVEVLDFVDFMDFLSRKSAVQRIAGGETAMPANHVVGLKT